MTKNPNFVLSESQFAVLGHIAEAVGRFLQGREDDIQARAAQTAAAAATAIPYLGEAERAEIEKAAAAALLREVKALVASNPSVVLEAIRSRGSKSG